MVSTINSINSKKKAHINKHLIYLVWVIVICAVSTGLSVFLNQGGIGKENILMIFLVGVLITTVLTKGYLYGFIISVLNLIMFTYFFAEPQNSFLMINIQDYILIAFFLIASLICGTMSSKLQHQMDLAKQRAHTSQLLYNVSESLLKLAGVQSIVETTMNYLYDYTESPCSVSLDNKRFDNKTNYATQDFSVEDANASETYVLPIKALSRKMGTITFAKVKLPLSKETDMFIKTVVYQMALVLDREFLYNERERIKLSMESEHLKSTLLRSISHDLRTPLTGIIGASSMILDGYDSLNESSIKKLASDINEEASWLIKSVQNILDMTRISDSKLIIKKDYEAVDDLINQAVIRIPRLASTNRLEVILPEDILLVEVDGRLIVQVLVNLLDNAYKHSGETSQIKLKAYKEEDSVIFEISDNGLGIDPSIHDTLFFSFVTLSSADSSRGVGLGLTICKAVVDAHQGRITAFNRPEGGAVFRIELPYDEEQSTREDQPSKEEYRGLDSDR